MDSLWCNETFCCLKIFSTFAFFKETKEGRRRDGVSLSLWWNSIGASEPLSAGGIFALGNTVGFKDRGLGRGHFVTHSSLCLFFHFSTFSNPSCGKRQSTTDSGWPMPQCHISISTDLATGQGHQLTTILLFLVSLMLLVISPGRPQLLSVYWLSSLSS